MRIATRDDGAPSFDQPTAGLASPSPASGRVRSSYSGKRLTDVVLGVVGLVLTAPILVMIAVLVAATSRGPVLYRHERVGRGGRRFRIVKFRTMVRDADRQLDDILAGDPGLRDEFDRTHKLQDDPRITRLGRLLRRTSLDELPQFLNVLLGHMSIVGPRPIVEEELDRYGDAAPVYLALRPGMTGLWQTEGRNDTSYDQRVALDVAYARRQSLGLDALTLARTALVVLRRAGAY